MNTKETAAKLPRLNSTNLTSAAVLIALAVLLSAISPAFRDPQNLINILQQVTVNAILALGMTMVIFTGGIDLSVGSVVAFSGIVMGILVIDLGVNPWLAALLGIALGSVCGTINAEMGQGAVQAIQQSGITRRIAVYDFDASSDDIAAIRAGTLVGSVAQYPKLQAEGAINAALAAMAGKNLPAHTVTKAELITAANVDTLE